jgi:hypothetical protein
MYGAHLLHGVEIDHGRLMRQSPLARKLKSKADTAEIKLKAGN